MTSKIGRIATLAVACLALTAPSASAQHDAADRGSRNVSVVSRLALSGSSGDIKIDQDPARPYVYVTQSSATGGGFAVISLQDPDAPSVLFTWEQDNRQANDALKARDLTYVKLADRQYLLQTFQAEAEPAEPIAGALVFDVTDLSDPSSVREVVRLSSPEAPRGFYDLFAYKHSDGRALLFASGGDQVHVYDVQALLRGNQDPLAQIDLPEQLNTPATGYHDVFVGFEPESSQDRFYGAGAGGYYVYDVTDLTAPTLLTTISSAAVQQGHAITPTPDGRYVVTAAGYRTAPLRLFDLKPGLDGTLSRLRTAVGAWTADWRHLAEQHEMRWPYVFVAARDGGLQIFNMRDPVNPYTVGFYRTWDGPPGTLADPNSDNTGAWDLDVRNDDGLIVVSDITTGLWVFSLEGFEGWHGHGWGLPNMSSAQDWDDGPDGK